MYHFYITPSVSPLKFQRPSSLSIPNCINPNFLFLSSYLSALVSHQFCSVCDFEMGSRAKESELYKYEDRAYRQLKEGIYRTKYGGRIFRCPFCVEKKNQDYLYDDLLQHARSRGKGSKSMGLKQQGQHLALASYLARYHCPKAPPTPSNKGDLHDQSGGGYVMSNRAVHSYGKEMHAGVGNSSETLKSSGEQETDAEQNKSEKFVRSDKGELHGQCGGGDATLSIVMHSSGKDMHTGCGNSSEVLKSSREQDTDAEQNKSKKFAPSNKGELHGQCGGGDAASSIVVHSSGKEMHAGCDNSSEILKSSGEQATYAEQNKSKKFVHPWKGVVVNVPVEFKDGRYVGDSGKKLKEQLIEKGFNPEKVTPLWNHNGFSGTCLVDFIGNWVGYENAMRFEKAFEVDHHGKMDWYKVKSRGDKLYGWVATEEDYQSNSLFRKYLKKCNLKSIEDIEAEEKRKKNSLVAQLESSIQNKVLQHKMMENKLEATSITIDRVMDETDAMTEAHDREMSDMHRIEHERMERMLVEHERIKKRIESQKNQLKLREKELERREVRNENEKRELSRQQRKNELADEKQKQVHRKLLRLAEEQKKEKEALHKKSIDLEKELDHKQALELEVERMRGAVKIMEHMGDEEDVEVKKKMESLTEDLEEKIEELEALDDLNQTLIIKEHKANEEMQEALNALINGLHSGSSKGARPNIGVKKIGELDGKLFEIAAKRKYSADMASEKAAEWWSLWEAYMSDTSWCPFKDISEKGPNKEVINEEDERLQELRNELGEEVYNAVVTVLMEMNEYSPQDRTPRLELWNFKEQRRSNLHEGVIFLLNKWKLARRRK